ncbi:CRISPR-associated Cse2 family protein [Corynebacterium kutscheri]|uniref:CRISPR-associated Cse2 family protein n=1 Tax=Corynebacterium kutscheri TaxID=35755 RepID=A0A0F6TD96_9CORY|nr:type I-E CRISPR-associated protein Cse2/CasB [Corynebacterium kutscheri]AKE41059.1 hypothetical protein UL82_04290 [Corynebacterium kutscheri]VEH06948.1 CRISPR-associated Cse2 family protein [Corynebacterium kutscheri]VEH09361.1 CRISPR-associated Cse2 family protein [Corynebacterium kutscheri]VEH79443.1 CRISPR-associated Cse2 family protein [Corynebacterium kutscheri]
MTSSISNKIASHVYSKIGPLQTNYLADYSSAKAELAELRRSANNPKASFKIWSLVFDNLDEELIGKGDRFNRAERALLTTFQLYAIHQQSSNKPMHVTAKTTGAEQSFPQGLGTAVRRIANPNDSDDWEQAILRRFSSVVNASTFEGTKHHLRGLIQIFRAKDIPLNYGLLAKDLYRLQFPEAVQSVHLRWARELYQRSPETSKTAEVSA